MRSAGNFNPEWGYLAPAPSFVRTLRVVLVATAIGATAGAAVVISLIDRPGGEDRAAFVTPHAIVTSAHAAPATAAPAVAASSVKMMPTEQPPALSSTVVAPTFPQVTPPVAPQVTVPAAQARASAPPAADASPAPDAVVPAQSSLSSAAPENSTPNDAVEPRRSTGMAALSEASPANETAHAADLPDQSLVPPEPVPEEKKAKHHVASASATNDRNKSTLGSMLRRIFKPPSGSSYYPNR